MATKNYCLSFKEKHDLSDTLNNRNINLNRNHSCVETVQLNDFSNKSKKVQNYARLRLSGFITHNTQRSKSSLSSWEKSENNFPLEFLNIHFGSDKNGSKEGKDSEGKIKNGSTLSLHIAAYEDSIEAAAAASDSIEGNNISKDKSNFIKSLANVKDMKLSSAIVSPFEFPRQQTDDKIDPAIMQFTASQKLISPNQGNGDSVTANKAMDSSVLTGNPRNEGIQQEMKVLSLDPAAAMMPVIDYIYPPSLLNDIKVEISQGYQIRPLTAKDFDNGFIQVLSQLTVVGEVSPKEVMDRFRIMASMNPLSYYITVIEDIATQKIVGAATLVIELKFIHGVGCRGRIEDVVVDSEKRGLGLAKSLNETLVTLAKRLGVYKLSLECKDALIPFYEKFGYKKDEGNNFLVQRFD